MPIFSSVNIISKWSWCPVFRCFVQTKLFELDGSSCFSFISRGGWYSLMRPRRFHSRFFSDIEWISRNSASVSLLFFYLSILFFLIPVQPWIWWTHQEVSSNFLVFAFDIVLLKIQSRIYWGPVFRWFVYLKVIIDLYIDLYIFFLFRINLVILTRQFVMFLFYFLRWVVQSYISKKILFSLYPEFWIN